ERAVDAAGLADLPFRQLQPVRPHIGRYPRRRRALLTRRRGATGCSGGARSQAGARTSANARTGAKSRPAALIIVTRPRPGGRAGWGFIIGAACAGHGVDAAARP